jgi:hypothetical protein
MYGMSPIGKQWERSPIRDMLVNAGSQRAAMLMPVDMRTSMNALRIVIRVLGTLLIVLGLLFWTGNALALLPLHMLGGMLLVLTLWSLAILAARIGEQPALVAIALLWGVVVPILGMTQDSLLPGDAHWVIKVLHLLVGITAISLGEVLTRRGLARLPAHQLAHA